jgi:DNA-binding transcriptional LysR family regulator
LHILTLFWFIVAIVDTRKYGIEPSKAACLISAIEEGTVRSAASRLSLEPSTVSRKIAALQADLDIQLIERGRLGVKLTDTGELVMLHLRRQRSDVEVLRSELDSLQSLRRGKILIAVGEGFVADLIGNALESFSQVHSGITYSLHTGSTDDVVNAVVNDAAHLGIAFNANPPQQIRTLARAPQPLMMIAAKNSRFANLKEPVSLKTVKDLPCAVLDQGSGLRAIIEKAESIHGVRFNITLETNSIAAIKNYVREGLGVSVMAEYVVTREILDGHVVSRRLNIPEFKQGDTHLIMRQGRLLPPAACQLSNHLLETMVAFSSLNTNPKSPKLKLG